MKGRTFLNLQVFRSLLWALALPFLEFAQCLRTGNALGKGLDERCLIVS